MEEEQGFIKEKKTYTPAIMFIFHPLRFFFKFANMQSEKEQKK